MNKVFHKRLKPMNSLTNMNVTLKIIDLQSSDYNEKFAERVIREFGIPKTFKHVEETTQRCSKKRYLQTCFTMNRGYPSFSISSMENP
ncbi:hypothetical protein, partial [Megasphaera massiliensis]|uniref:hypothetical protein n=1 Tax=Megasphaera massiliensis TaxID=1232428 RepID=UPI0005C98CE5